MTDLFPADAVRADRARQLADQVACIERELRMRRRVYPNWVAQGRMSQAKADYEIELMEGVLATLKEAL